MNHASTLEAIEHFTKQYTNVTQKLPPLEEFDHQTDILETIGRERHYPRNVVRYTRWYLIRVLNGWAGYLHEFILPNQQSAVSMEEYNYFDEKEKEGIIKLINWIMYRSRQNHALQLDEDDDKSAAFIMTVWDEWLARKELLRTVVKKNTDVWQKKVEE